MDAELRQRILAYNKAKAEHEKKAADMKILADALKRLPYGQLKKVMTKEVMEVLAKYGITEEGDT